jgi:hypothetical protein
MRFARVDMFFRRDQPTEHAVDVVLVIAERAQWHRLVFDDDAGFQSALQQV